MSLRPLRSAEFICGHAKHVHINPSGLEKVVQNVYSALSSGTFGIGKWTDHELTPSVPDDRAIEWIFVTDLLNFSFWTDKNDPYEVVYNDKIYTGYWALCAAVNRAIEEDFDILDPNTYQHISETQLGRIFRSTRGVPIPLLSERLHLLQQSGKTLVQKFNGAFKNVLQLCDGSARKLLDLLCEHFPSFRDNAIYEGQEVWFLKRAQILVGDIWSCFNGKGLGAFDDIEDITAFADYRVPQVLAYFGVISYSDELLNVLRKGELIPNGDRKEVEIRGATIHATQLIVQQVKNMLISRGHVDVKCNAIIVDNYLWTFRRRHAEEIDAVVPMHKTRCIFY